VMTPPLRTNFSLGFSVSFKGICFVGPAVSRSLPYLARASAVTGTATE
jgi:hypothetical protein